MERLNFFCMLVVFQSFAILQYPLLCYAFINFCFSFWDKVLLWCSPGKSWTCNLPAFPELQKIITPAKNFKEKNNCYTGEWQWASKCLWGWNWAIAPVTGPSGPVLISLASPNLGGGLQDTCSAVDTWCVNLCAQEPEGRAQALSWICPAAPESV